MPALRFFFCRERVVHRDPVLAVVAAVLGLSLTSLWRAPRSLDLVRCELSDVAANPLHVEVHHLADGLEGQQLGTFLLTQLPPGVILVFFEEPDVGIMGNRALVHAPGTSVQDPVIRGPTEDLKQENPDSFPAVFGRRFRKLQERFLHPSVLLTLGVPGRRWQRLRGALLRALRGRSGQLGNLEREGIEGAPQGVQNGTSRLLLPQEDSGPNGGLGGPGENSYASMRAREPSSY